MTVALPHTTDIHPISLGLFRLYQSERYWSLRKTRHVVKYLNRRHWKTVDTRRQSLLCAFRRLWQTITEAH